MLNRRQSNWVQSNTMMRNASFSNAIYLNRQRSWYLASRIQLFSMRSTSAFHYITTFPKWWPSENNLIFASKLSKIIYSYELFSNKESEPAKSHYQFKKKLTHLILSRDEKRLILSESYANYYNYFYCLEDRISSYFNIIKNNRKINRINN